MNIEKILEWIAFSAFSILIVYILSCQLIYDWHILKHVHIGH